MSSKKKKIVIPTEDEVKNYGGENESPESGNDSATPEASVEDTARPEAADSATSAPSGESTEPENQDFKDKYLRAKAEMVNFQRRAEKSREEAVKYAHASLVKGLLPALDDLERVIDSGTQHPENAEAILNGVKMTYENLVKVLREFSVQPIEAQGKPFDPSEHEAMMQQPSDEHPDQTVLQEVQRGYRLHDRVLRPAKVIVSKSSQPADESEKDSSSQG